MFRILRLQFRTWKTKPMVWIGFLLGMSFVLANTLDVVRTAQGSEEWIQMFEPTILSGSSAWQSLFLLLGVLLILSDSPFLNDLTPAVTMRASRIKWFAAQILYILATCFLYYLILTAFSMILSLSVSYPQNVWSHLLYSAASGKSDAIEFSNLSFMKTWLPVSAWMITIFFQTIYAATLEWILFFINTHMRRNGGICIVMLIHILGYVLFLEGFAGIRKLSLLIHALPALHVDQFVHGLNAAPTVIESVIVFTFIDLLLIIGLFRSAKRFDFL